MRPGERRFSFFQHKDCEFFPCHETDRPEDFNCLFCYCPLYTLGSACGGSCAWLPGGVKDCGGCLVPHERNSYSYVASKFPDLSRLAGENR